MNANYGEKIKMLRTQMGLTQHQVAENLQVTPGYISNVENGRTAMSLRILMYYAQFMGVTLDSLVGQLEPEYQASAIDTELMQLISKMDLESKKKLLEILKICNR
ncbi:helix-turn-helix domain-containing protein [Butyrivibrio sp. INlla16]|uniref:helix-turn-helix domain-containing protein n=1 Tax=Butyrivibrio sp. INlla16 TaxID=1520807 RepID=UPI00087F674D|nr:helix-turn-helix transcriptional regulator [Butyrivibrio sp. INlla16]SDB41372.1 Transcriptional regulator, contains XRE-family HTH domain [Butyrivibrio sp. INlla16]